MRAQTEVPHTVRCAQRPARLSWAVSSFAARVARARTPHNRAHRQPHSANLTPLLSLPSGGRGAEAGWPGGVLAQRPQPRVGTRARHATQSCQSVMRTWLPQRFRSKRARPHRGKGQKRYLGTLPCGMWGRPPTKKSFLGKRGSRVRHGHYSPPRRGRHRVRAATEAEDCCTTRVRAAPNRARHGACLSFGAVAGPCDRVASWWMAPPPPRVHDP